MDKGNPSKVHATVTLPKTPGISNGPNSDQIQQTVTYLK